MSFLPSMKMGVFSKGWSPSQLPGKVLWFDMGSSSNMTLHSSHALTNCTYDSGSELVTLTHAGARNVIPLENVTISGATGSYAGLNGTWVVNTSANGTWSFIGPDGFGLPAGPAAITGSPVYIPVHRWINIIPNRFSPGTMNLSSSSREGAMRWDATKGAVWALPTLLHNMRFSNGNPGDFPPVINGNPTMCAVVFEREPSTGNGSILAPLTGSEYRLFTNNTNYNQGVSTNLNSGSPANVNTATRRLIIARSNGVDSRQIFRDTVTTPLNSSTGNETPNSTGSSTWYVGYGSAQNFRGYLFGLIYCNNFLTTGELESLAEYMDNEYGPVG